MSPGEQAEIVEFLKTVAAPTGPDDEPKVIETHISIIVLKGETAWKIKRAIRLPYADFSTATLREQACQQEIALNRRTAPTIYLAARRITREPDGSLALDGTGPLVDAAVEMRRFDETTLFSNLAQARKLDTALLSALARRIAAFHAQAPISGQAGGADNIAAILSLNEQDTAMPAVLGTEPTQALRDALRAELDRHRSLLDARAAAGNIRRCHGDLHLRNLCLVEGEPTLFDCIEFNTELATIDVLYDLAFLLMDLWQADLAAEANWVMNRYLDETAQTDGLPLLPFFMALRASIRAQVLATQAHMSDARPGDGIIAQAQRYLDLAMRLLTPAAPRLIAIGGLSGSGKSTVAAAVAHHIGAPPGARILASDRIRKALAGVDAETTLPPETYTAEASQRVYSSLYTCARETLSVAWPVIADAVFSKAQERERIAACAAEAKVEFLGIWLDAPAAALVSRVRARRHDPSDATAEVVQQQLERGHGQIEWTVVPAGETAHSTAERVLAIALTPPWSQAPEGWNWRAQDEDGRWFWYAVGPQLGMAGGVWRSPRRAQLFAGDGVPQANWYETCTKRDETHD